MSMTKQLLVVIARSLWTSHTQSYTVAWLWTTQGNFVHLNSQGLGSR